MERSISSESTERRLRRLSLPGSVMLSSTCSDFADVCGSKKTSRLSSDISSSASLYKVGGDDPNPMDGSVFKIPGRPASSYGGFPRTRVMSALDVVGEDGVAGESGKESPLLASRTFMVRTPSAPRRTNSMSGSAELLIRPQIVVRPRKNPARQKEVSDTPIVITPKEENPSREIERTLSLEGNKWNRAGSEELTLIPRQEESSKNGSGSLAVQVPHRQSRRKSLDSWTAFSFFGGESQQSSTEQNSRPSSSITTANDISPSNSSQGFSPTAALSSSRSAWLSSWTSDWGSNRKDTRVTTTAHSPGLENNDDVVSRPASIISNEGAAQLSRFAFPRTSSSNSNLVTSGLGLNNTTGSIKYHDSNQTISDMTTSSGHHAKKAASIKSNSSSNHSHHHNYTRSEDLHIPERRYKSSRSRLLSISSPSEPLPPQLYPESAAADYFQVAGGSHGHHSYHLSRVLEGPYTPNDSNIHIHSGFADQLTPRSFSSIEGYFSPPLTKIQIPSPVDEITDPMSKVKVP